MNLRDELLREHSKRQTTMLVQWISNDQRRFAELMELFLRDEYRVVQRAAWVLGDCARLNPQLVSGHLMNIVDNLFRSDLHDAVKRNTVRILKDIEIPEDCQGKAAEICFRFLASPEEAIAVKAFSTQVLFKLSKQHPDLKPELRLLIEQQMPHASVGFRSCGSKILKALNKRVQA
jgi:hypothetical protein